MDFKTNPCTKSKDVRAMSRREAAREVEALRERLGVRARSPRWAVAWKFERRAEVTTVEDIVLPVGRTGILAPVALLQPVGVGGA